MKIISFLISCLLTKALAVVEKAAALDKNDFLDKLDASDLEDLKDLKDKSPEEVLVALGYEEDDKDIQEHRELFFYKLKKRLWKSCTNGDDADLCGLLCDIFPDTCDSICDALADAGKSEVAGQLEFCSSSSVAPCLSFEPLVDLHLGSLSLGGSLSVNDTLVGRPIKPAPITTCQTIDAETMWLSVDIAAGAQSITATLCNSAIQHDTEIDILSCAGGSDSCLDGGDDECSGCCNSHAAADVPSITGPQRLYIAVHTWAPSKTPDAFTLDIISTAE